MRDDCEQMMGRCTCKEGISGQKCNLCENGKRLGPQGCSGERYRTFSLRALGIWSELGSLLVNPVSTAAHTLIIPSTIPFFTLLAGYSLRGKSSVKLYNFFLVNVGLVIVIAMTDWL